MPLLRRQVFKKEPNNEKLPGNQQVFYCEATKEMFTNYEDYIQRIMLVNSMVWTCDLTGRPNLTYAEALESEKNARKLLKNFPEEVKVPALMLAKQTKRCSINELVDDVFGFVNQRFFIGEAVFRDTDPKNLKPYRVLEVIQTNTKNNSPSSYKYRIEIENPNQTKGASIMTLKGDDIHRIRVGSFSKDRLKMFIKQYVEQVNTIVKVKEDIYKKIVENRNIKWSNVFAGQMPDFAISKKYELGLEKERMQQEKATKRAKTPKVNNNNVKKSTAGTKQASIANYLTKTDENSDKKVNGIVKPLITPEEAERLKKKKEDELKHLEEERKKKLEEDKARRAADNLLLRREVSKFSNLNQEDLLLQDQIPLPKYKAVQTLIPNKYFGDFVTILEFIHSFSELLSIQDTFPHGVTMEILERALLLREYSGPLTDIFQVLLSTIFSLQMEEEGECEMVYIKPQSELLKPNLNESEIAMLHATEAAHHSIRHYLGKLHALPMDTNAVSELLRLHLLMSGAKVEDKSARYRFLNRGGYSSCDDPALEIRIKYPHIIRGLSQYSVVQLPMNDIIKLLLCLINQIKTFPTFRDAIEERQDLASKARHNVRNMIAEERKRKVDLAKKVKEMEAEIKKKLDEFQSENPEDKVKLQEELDAKHAAELRTMDVTSAKVTKDYLESFTKLKQEVFAYQIYLGSDRAYRAYYIFESLPGIFINHEFATPGVCNETIPENLPHLRDCPAEDRARHLRDYVRKKFSLDSENKENKIKKHITGGTGKLNGDTAVITPSISLQPIPQIDLFMCTTNPKDCPVHSESYTGRQNWSYISTEEELDALIKTLNPYGLRERPLLDNLEFERALIIAHIKECPVDKISVNLDHKNKILEAMVQNMKKYNSLHGMTKDVNEYIGHTLREQILELYDKVFTSGCLGSLKVNDVDAWVRALENGSYSMETDELVYGSKKCRVNGDVNGGDADSGDDMKSTNYVDPSANLGNTLDIESEDSSDDGISLHESPDLKKVVQNLASALLQIRQGIEIKFLTAPLGLKGNKFSDEITYQIDRNINYWDKSLMAATNYSQIFLHYNLLYDSIRWSKAANRAACQLCRRKKDPEKMLLCDKCNCGCHMYCLKPKLKTVPEGDWFCPKCAPPKVVVNSKKRKRQLFAELEEESISDSDDETIRERPTTVPKMGDEDSVDDSTYCENGEDSDFEVQTVKFKRGKYAAKTKDKIPATEPAAKKKSFQNKNNSKQRNVEEVSGGEEEEEVEEPEAKKKTSRKSSPKSNSKSKRIVAEENDEEEEEVEETEQPKKKKSKRLSLIDQVLASLPPSDDEDSIAGVKKSKRNKKRNSKRVLSDAENGDNDESDEEPLIKKKRGQRSGNDEPEEKLKKRGSGKRKKYCETSEIEDDEALSDDEQVPAKKARRSRNSLNNKVEKSKKTRRSDSPSASATKNKSPRDRRSRAVDDGLPLHNVILYELLEDISKHADSWPFNRPVSKQEVPDYYDIIQVPMDFAKIKSRLNLGYYKSDYDIMGDIQQVFANCDLYNTCETEIFDAGVRLEKFIQKQCLELNLPFRSSDMISERD